MGDPRRERPPAMYGHIINVPTHFNVKLPAISGHLPNADADSHLLVVSTWYNGQCKQMNQKSLALTLIATDSSLKCPCCRLVTRDRRAICHVIESDEPHDGGKSTHSLVIRLFYDTTSEKSCLLFFQPAMSKKRTILSLDQGIEVLCRLGEAHHVDRLLSGQCGKNANGTYDIKADRKGNRGLR